MPIEAANAERHRPLSARYHWRFTGISDGARAIANLRQCLESAGCRCMESQGRLIAAGKLARYRVEPDDNGAVLVAADYRRLFLFYPIAVTATLALLGIGASVFSGDALFLALGAAGMAIGLISYITDTLTVPRRQKRILIEVFAAAETPAPRE